jgi:hypothetical protein
MVADGRLFIIFYVPVFFCNASWAFFPLLNPSGALGQASLAAKKRQ